MSEHKKKTFYESLSLLTNILTEIDRSRYSRDASFQSPQSAYDSATPDYDDLDEEEIYARASEEAMEAVELEASQSGYDDIDLFARDMYGLEDQDVNGQLYSAGEQLINNYIELYEDMIKRGEI